MQKNCRIESFDTVLMTVLAVSLIVTAVLTVLMIQGN